AGVAAGCVGLCVVKRKVGVVGEGARLVRVGVYVSVKGRVGGGSVIGGHKVVARRERHVAGRVNGRVGGGSVIGGQHVVGRCERRRVGAGFVESDVVRSHKVVARSIVGRVHPRDGAWRIREVKVGRARVGGERRAVGGGVVGRCAIKVGRRRRLVG